LPLAPSARAAATEALKAARVPNVLCAFLMAGHRILTAVSNRQYRPDALDLGMVVNLIMSSSSLRIGESWTPVCLSRFNDKGFAYAYISFLEGSDLGVVFLSTASDGEQFYAISQQAALVKKALQQSACSDAVAEALSKSPIDLGAMPSSSAGSSSSEHAQGRHAPARKSLLAPSSSGTWTLLEGVIHAAYYSPTLQQYFSSAISKPYQTRRRVKMLFRNYGRCRQLLRTAKVPSQVCVATDHECYYVSISSEYHLYLAVPRGISTGVIGQFYQWVRSQEPHIFLGQIPTW